MPDRPRELRQIGQVRIEVTDADRAVAFYRDVLGPGLVGRLAFASCPRATVRLVASILATRTGHAGPGRR